MRHSCCVCRGVSTHHTIRSPPFWLSFSFAVSTFGDVIEFTSFIRTPSSSQRYSPGSPTISFCSCLISAALPQFLHASTFIRPGGMRNGNQNTTRSHISKNGGTLNAGPNMLKERCGHLRLRHASNLPEFPHHPLSAWSSFFYASTTTQCRCSHAGPTSKYNFPAVSSSHSNPQKLSRNKT